MAWSRRKQPGLFLAAAGPRESEVEAAPVGPLGRPLKALDLSPAVSTWKTHGGGSSSRAEAQCQLLTAESG